MQKYDYAERKEFVRDLFFNVGYECRCSTFQRRNSDLKNSVVSGNAGVHLSQIQDWDKYELNCRGYYNYATVVFDVHSDLSSMLNRAYPETVFKDDGTDTIFIDFYCKVRIGDEFQDIFPYTPLNAPKVVSEESVYEVDDFVLYSSQDSKAYSEIVFCNKDGNLTYNYFVTEHGSGYLMCLAESILKRGDIKDIIDRDGSCVYVPVKGRVQQCGHIHIN